MGGVAATAALALVLTACSSGDGGGDGDGSAAPTDDSGINTSTAVNVAWEAPFNEFNTSSENGNATQNAVVTNFTTAAFNYYTPELELTPDESFGTYERISEDPLEVKLTIADTATWSDGTPVTAADLLLQWAATSGAFNNVEPEYDEEGNVTNQDAIDAGVYFDGTSPSVALISEVPTVSDDGKEVTLKYDSVFPDWELVTLSPVVPAHIVAAKAVEGGTADALVTAIQEGDASVLGPVSKFWNSGYEFTSMPSDPDLLISSGPYVITDYVENQYLTVTKNAEYKGDLNTGPESVTFRYIDDPMAQVTALQNGEVDLIGPQASADVLTALNALDGVTVKTGNEGTYEHVDLVFQNGGPFDPATYGGDEAKALAVRKAFLSVIPRQTIIDNLIKPLNPDAEIRKSYILAVDDPNYDKMVEGNGSADFPDDADIEAAKALLAEAGVATPVTVRFAFNADNTRRQNEFALITDAATQAGFTLVDASAPATEWGTKLATMQTEYDASLFAWQSTSTGVTDSAANYITDGINNYGLYSSADVDGIFDTLNSTLDADEQFNLQQQAEQQLWGDAFGTTIFQFPAIQGWSDKLEGVDPSPLSPTIFYGFWNWKISE